MSRQGYRSDSSTSGRYQYPAQPEQIYQRDPTAPGRQYPGQTLQDPAGNNQRAPRSLPYTINSPTAGSSRSAQVSDEQYRVSPYSAYPTQYTGSRQDSTMTRRTTQPPSRSNTGASSSSRTPPHWTFDFVPMYDLDEEDLEVWLRNHFGNADFHVEPFGQDQYRFYVPRKLYDYEKDEIARIPDEKEEAARR